MKKYARYLPYLGFAILSGLFVITRFWRLDTIPSGLHLDEAGMAYDAMCLAEYGVDRYLNPWPLYLTNYGGGQSILYAYLCAGLFKLFGYSVWMVRLPIICFSFFMLVFGIKIAEMVFPDKPYFAYLTGLLTIICPYFILNGRFGLDCNLMLGISVVFLYFFLQALLQDKAFPCIMAGVIGGITLYTYVLSYLILPLFLLFGLAYSIWVKRFSLKKWVLMAIPMGIIATPLIVVQIVNLFDLPELHLAGFTFTKLEIYRAGELGSFRWSNFLMALKCIFIGDDLNYTSVPSFCNFYVVTIVFFVIGLARVIGRFVNSIRRREADPAVVVLLWFLTVFLLFCHMLSNIYRINPAYFAMLLVAVQGVETICALFKRISPAVLCAAVATGYLFCFLRFGVYYYLGDYTRENYPLDHFGITVAGAVAFLEEHPEYRNKGTYMAQPDVYFALSRHASPYEIEIDPHIHGHLQYGYYQCGTLPDIDPDYNYIVQDIFNGYAEELRALGFAEIAYPNYSLFIGGQDK